MNKQSSVQWLFQKLWDTPKDKFEWHSIFLMAHQMHKEEMDKVAGDFWNEGASYMYDGKRKYNSFDEYYNETFGGQDNE